MSEINLLTFGCIVSFIVVAGVYTYARECFTASEQCREPEGSSEDVVEKNLREVA